MTTVVRIKYGSHLYGTNTPTSDCDYKSVHIPDAEDILLQRVKPEIVLCGRDKAEGEKNSPGDIDDKSYSLHKFLDLATEGQTLAIDMLFAPPKSIEKTSYLWKLLQRNRHKLISRKSAAFLGYCRQQANKYGIKGSRVAAAKASSEIFSGLADTLGPKVRVGDVPWARIADLCQNEHTKLTEAELGSTGEMGNFFECCGRKVSFTAPVRQAADIFTRIYQNYGARARQAQDNEGVDWKALSHAVRVGMEAKELLTTGHVTLPLPEAGLVRDIKLGLFPYQEVSERIEQLLVEVEEASLVSKLPDEPDAEFIKDVIISVYAGEVADRFIGTGIVQGA